MTKWKLLISFAVIFLGREAVATDKDVAGLLATAKMAGACGILDQLIEFQKITKMEGGDDLVVRFWNVEAARLGLSVNQLSDTCTESIEAYDQVFKQLTSGS